MLGVHVEAGPSTQEIIAAFERCEGWSRDDRNRLAYLAIFIGYIEGRKYSTPTRVSLARLVMKVERFENYPWGRVAFKTRVINFVQKDIGEMFPKWEFYVEDTPAENIIKLIFVKKPWKWTMDCWEVTGTWVNTKPAVVSPAKKNVVKEDSPRPQKKPHKEASEEASEEAAAVASEEAAAKASEEIKYLSERVEAVEKKVGITTKRKGTSAQNTTPPKPTLEPGVSNESSPNKRLIRQIIGYYCLKWIFGYYRINPSCLLLSESVNGTNAGRKSLPEDKGLDVPADASSSKDKAPEPSLVLLDKNQSTVSDLQKEDARYLEKKDVALALCRAKSDRTRKLAASQQFPYTANSTAKVIIPNKKIYPGYNPFASIFKKKLKELADCHYRTPLNKKPRTSRTWWYQILRTSLEWLEACKTYQTTYWRYDANPQHFRSERMCFLDHLFAQQWRFNFKDFKDSKPDQNGLGRRLPGGAWNYYACTIPSFCQSNKRHIVVWDNICSSISPEELDVVMEHFLYMVTYLLVECASSDEQCAQYSLEPFIYERLTNIPPARAGDCGVYSLKYIECHALGIKFSRKDFAKPNGKTMRDKMAVDIFQELPDAHEFKNKDNDANLGAYEG
uniref:Ubiquitin-like protease family profile domain-containing protein n=1 Tax=Brassica oleracea var. oleracea TaxID=109376 RepID=A0A0D3A5F8_BRAOL